ncbi:hypothetical protein [Burkholderia cepacia]|uniref:hypothetical protein n=1 Tax=Burkholderia cepacia TaxID=292 RepID=UPI0015895D77|nr:hypothetical protein [Burkholderia cepacia]
MELHQQLVDYLKTKTENKLLMNPEQLEQETGITEKQQSKLRKENNFPIPWKNVGRNVFYSIFHVADFLLNGEVKQHEEIKEDNNVVEVKKEPKPKMVQPKSNSKNPVQDLSFLAKMKFLANHVQEQATELQNLADNLNMYHGSLELKLKLEGQLSNDKEKHEVVKE